MTKFNSVVLTALCALTIPGCLADEAAPDPDQASAPTAPDTSTATQAVTTGPFFMRNSGTGMCLQPQVESMGEAIIVQSPCRNIFDPLVDAQLWSFSPSISTGVYRIVNQRSSLCMYFNGQKIEDGTPLVQTGCNSTSNEMWKPSATPPDLMTVMSRLGVRDTGFCMEEAFAFDGWPLNVRQCNGSSVQTFNVTF